jgi:hypothetical protein
MSKDFRPPSLFFRSWLCVVLLLAIFQPAHAESTNCSDTKLAALENSVTIYGSDFFHRTRIRCADSPQAQTVLNTLNALSELRFGNASAEPLFNQSLLPDVPWTYFSQAFADRGITLWLGSDACTDRKLAIGSGNGIAICEPFYRVSPALQMAVMMHEASHVRAKMRNQFHTAEHVPCALGNAGCDLSLRQKGAYAVGAEFLSKLAVYAPSRERKDEALDQLRSARSWFALDPYQEAQSDATRERDFNALGDGIFAVNGVWYHRAPDDVAHSLFHMLRARFKATTYCVAGGCNVRLFDLHCEAGRDEFDIDCLASSGNGQVRTKISKLELGGMMTLVQMLRPHTSMVEIAEKSLTLPFDLAAIQCSEFAEQEQDGEWNFSCRALKKDAKTEAAKAAAVRPQFRKRYGDTLLLGKFKFGMSPDDVNKLLPIPYDTLYLEATSLPTAGEYAPTEVRYLWRKLSEFQTLPYAGLYLGCATGNSYVAFLFDQTGLFRVSLRLIDDCPTRRTVVTKLADQFNQRLVSARSRRYFATNMADGLFVGVESDSETSLEWVREGSPKFTDQPWP